MARAATLPAMAMATALAGLLSLYAAYAFTREPAPLIHVRWRAGTTPAQRTGLEWKYRLTDRRALEGLTFEYVLMDTRATNIKALVQDPEVADTADLDRAKFEVPWETANDSERFTWIANRIPVVRQPVARWTLVAALAVMLVSAARAVVAAVRWRALARGARDWLQRMPDGTEP